MGHAINGPTVNQCLPKVPRHVLRRNVVAVSVANGDSGRCEVSCFVSVTYNKRVVGEGVSDFQVLEEVRAPVVGVSPRHGGADGAHLQHKSAVRVCA